jgi:large subunit ribosomal protein L34e
LNGIPRLTKTQFRSLPKRARTVSRPYGGSLTSEAVRHRILRAFFNEELKVIKSSASLRKTGKKGKTQRKK